MNITVNGVELHYEQYGKGDTVIFSHGWLDDCSIWKPQSDLLAKDHRVILYDLRGHGRSEKPKGGYSVQTMADDLNALMQALGLEKAILVGFSLGSMISLMQTLLNPLKISRLVLVGATAKMPERKYITLALMRVLAWETLVKKIFPKFYFYKPSRKNIEDFITTALQVPKEVAWDTFLDFANKYDVRGSVSKIQVPTLLVTGEHDMGLPIRLSRYLNREIEGSRLHVIPQTGHRVMVEKPEEFNRILGHFLKETA